MFSGCRRFTWLELASPGKLWGGVKGGCTTSLIFMTKRSSGTGTLLAQTRGLLRSFDLRARKRLGQHFLIDEEVLQTIVNTAELSPSDLVIEVGPGIGVLTRELAKRSGWVIAVELDNKMADLLQQALASFHNVSIINEDVLKISPPVLIQKERAKFPAGIAETPDYKVVANLPYYITSPVLRHFCEAPLKPRIMVVMVQKEVAQAIVAVPGERSILSIAVQFYGRPELISHVPAASFYPPPRVDSAILKISMYPHPPLAVSDEKSFFELVRAGFAAPRKQLANSLASGLGLPRDEVHSLLERAGIVPQRRAETLTVEEWVQLWREQNKGEQ